MPLIVWQGFGLDIPSRWSPIKLEGDFTRGYVLMADLHRPRLGLRWDTPGKRKLDPAARVKRAMLDEVGQLAAAEAEEFPMAPAFEHGLLYTEPEPPGRDVWIGWSPAGGRVVQVIHHAHRRERILRDTVLPTFVDYGGQDMVPWAVFDLSCRVPARYKLESRQLNAGDLTLVFAAKNEHLRVRQIAVAELALKRRPLEKWLEAEQRLQKKHYRPAGALAASEIGALKGFSGKLRRRRRFFFAWQLPRAIETLALHDVARDRLVIVQGSEAGIVQETIDSIGWASAGDLPAEPEED